MTLTLDLPPDLETSLRRRATAAGEEESALAARLLAETQADFDASVAVIRAALAEDDPGILLADYIAGVEAARAARQLEKKPFLLTEEGRAAWHALFQQLEEGDPEEQRATLEQLQRDLEADRPGQRRVFGPGVNPMPEDGETRAA